MNRQRSPDAGIVLSICAAFGRNWAAAGSRPERAVEVSPGAAPAPKCVSSVRAAWDPFVVSRSLRTSPMSPPRSRASSSSSRFRWTPESQPSLMDSPVATGPVILSERSSLAGRPSRAAGHSLDRRSGGSDRSRGDVPRESVPRPARRRHSPPGAVQLLKRSELQLAAGLPAASRLGDRVPSIGSVRQGSRTRPSESSRSGAARRHRR